MPPNLAAQLAAYDIALSDERIARLDRYRESLWRWNEALNLTRHTTLEKFVGRDVVDSWRLAKLLPRGAKALDMGSGGGVPGVIIAICRPDVRMTLCESVQKKAKVLLAIVEELGLAIEVFACRAEELLAMRTFDAITARAVAPLPKILGWLAPHWDAFDELLLVKGKSWVDERAEARERGLLKRLELRKAAEYAIPIGEGPTTGEGASVILRISRPDDDAEVSEDLQSDDS